jgi:hypothetical protein
LQLQLGWNSWCGKQGALANTTLVAHSHIAFRGAGHAEIMRRASANVTRRVTSRSG